MSRLRLTSRLAWGTLRSRPTLTVLAVLLLALGTSIAGGLLGTVLLVKQLRMEFLSALTLELELASEADHAAVMQRAHSWPAVDGVRFVPPEVTLRELETEMGEDLRSLFDENPFPPLVRVQFSRISADRLESLAAEARTWPGVTHVVYPQNLGENLQRLSERLRGGLAYAAAAAVLLLLGLVGLCLRAQVRNRDATWEFLELSGLSAGTLGLALLLRDLMVGIMAGGMAVLAVFGLAEAYSLLLRQELAFPFWFYGALWGSAPLLAVVAGILSPRRSGTS